MTKVNASNERVKRDYFQYLKEAYGRDEATVDRAAKSIDRFEESTGRRDFKRFHRGQALAFKTKISVAANQRTGERLSKGTVLAVLSDLRAFFLWLAREPGFRSHVAYADADYFNLPDKEVAVARARREKRVPTLQQVDHVLSKMPIGNAWERRNRALIALAALTGARVSALASFRVADLDIAGGYLDQDARHVRTKFGKTFRTFLIPASERAMTILEEWRAEITADLTLGPDQPLFPSTEMGLDERGGFVAKGLSKDAWRTSGPVRDIFRNAFEAAGLPYFNPHSFRDMLVRYAMALDLSPEAMKALSQNLGHEDVLTTFTSYGAIPTERQGELIKKAFRKSVRKDNILADPKIRAAVMQALQDSASPC
jgi:integrase